MTIKRIAVYCAASDKIDRAYFEATERLARFLVDEGIEVVYGGGPMGLMGQLADTMIENGGRIRGVMPRLSRC